MLIGTFLVLTQERAAAKAELDRRLEETGLASTSKLEEATNQLAEVGCPFLVFFFLYLTQGTFSS